MSNLLAFAACLLCVLAEAAFFGISAYILYLIFIKKDTKTLDTIKKLRG